LNITPEEAIKYFNGYLESWRIAMGDLTNFILVGHSFGGYLVGNYALEYPQHIKKIVFISPIGIKPNF